MLLSDMGAGVQMFCEAMPLGLCKHHRGHLFRATRPLPFGNKILAPHLVTHRTVCYSAKLLFPSYSKDLGVPGGPRYRARESSERPSRRSVRRQRQGAAPHGIVAHRDPRRPQAAGMGRSGHHCRDGVGGL
ncbi:hypothetical protein NITMOv2_3637 [Nitrospira moscoviensis]|uniref:Uncharacterized protein n=1 Tax=Nitrospira moscoviensis TaxID=42253 RepID=A0A0K2GGR6_NITMO|nr:hypothetical protein NITMOv2_3637 [Nitrospira moscoviensis]